MKAKEGWAVIHQSWFLTLQDGCPPPRGAHAHPGQVRGSVAVLRETVELEDAVKLDGGGTRGTPEGLCQQQLTLSTLLLFSEVDDENPEKQGHTHTHTHRLCPTSCLSLHSVLCSC